MHITTIAEATARSQALQVADFHVDYQGSISILYPLTEDAEQWMHDNITTEATMWGRNGRVVEHRFVRDIVDGMLDAGLRSPASAG